MNDQARDRAQSFGSVAPDYDRYRPGYPEAAASLFPSLTGRKVADVGAGTGLLTSFLVGLGAQVTAIEVDPAMTDVLRSKAPAATVLLGAAESLPLRDASMDVVACSSAWHWFAQPAGESEFARVVRPGGHVFALWNGFDEDATWIEEIRQLREPNRQSPLARRQRAADFCDEWFRNVTQLKLPWTWSRTVDDVIGLFGTFSGLLAQKGDDRTRVLAEVRERLADHVVNGRLDLPMAVRGTTAIRQ